MAKRESKKAAKKAKAPALPKDDAPKAEKEGAKKGGEPYPEFLEGGRFCIDHLKDAKGKPLSYIKAKYHDPNGLVYDARIPPLPLNKGNIIEVPRENREEEYAKLALLPLEKQMEAFKDLQEEHSKPAMALLLNNKTTRLVEYGGHYFRAFRS